VYSAISRKRAKTGTYLLQNANNNSYTSIELSLPMTLSDF